MADPLNLASRMGFAPEAGGLNAIADRVRRTPFEAYRLRSSDALKADQVAADFLAPLEHFDFIKQMSSTSPAAGFGLAAASIPYNGFKAAGLDAIPKAFGTGESLTAQGSWNDISESFSGWAEGTKDWTSKFKMSPWGESTISDFGGWLGRLFD